MHFCGIDIGTQSLKAVVADEDLRLVGEGSVAYQPTFPRPLWAEQDAGLWLRALMPAIDQALRAAGVGAADVAAVGVSGQLDGCLPTDAMGEPVGPCIIWMDRRAEAMLRDVPCDEIRRRGGLVPDSTHMAAKIAWLKAHAGSGAVLYHQPVSFVVAKLTGRSVFDHGLASTTMLYDLASGAFDDVFLSAFGISADELPEIDQAHAVAGPLSSLGARLTGLPEGIPVAVGTGDDFSNVLGAGAVEPGRVVCALGTAEVVGGVARSPIVDAAGLVETHPFAGSAFFVENPGWLSGGALTWFAKTFRLGGVDELDTLAAAAPPGSDGVTFIPALSGAMAPEWISTARGAYYGLTAAHDARHMARATLEGCAFAMRDVVDRLADLGVATDRILTMGGGARSRIWAAIRADVARRPVDISATVDGSPMGAALLAAVACGRFDSITDAAARLDAAVTSLDPDPATETQYDDAYHAYRRLFDSLRAMF